MNKIFISALLFAFSISLSQAAIDRRSFDEMQKGMSREQALEYFEYVKLEAEMGDSFAQLVVGMIYMGGTDLVPENFKEAKKWLMMAARNGEETAKLALRTIFILEKRVRDQAKKK